MALATLRIRSNDRSSPKDIGLASLIGNAEQTANCPEGYTGDPVTVAAGAHTAQTLAAANALALAAAEAGLVCEEIGPQIVGVTFVSRSGGCTLHGVSKFIEPNDGDWNTRKYANMQGDSEYWVCKFTAAGCATENGRDYYTSPGAISIAAASGAQSVTGTRTQRLNASGTCLGSVSGGSFASFAEWWFAVPQQFPDIGTDASETAVATVDTVETAPWTTGCVENGGFWRAYHIPFQGGTLTNPRSVDEAMQANGSHTVGTANETIPGSIGSATATWGDGTNVFPNACLNGISVTSTQTSVATIECSNLTAMADYEITATLTRRDASDDSFISEEEVVIVFTAGDVTDTVDYPVPIEAGVKVKFTSADSIAAA